MANKRLNATELANANDLLADIRKRLDELSGDDRELRFAYNRKIAKELGYDERKTPMARRKLKREKWDEQNHRCAECSKEMPLAYSVLDRKNAVDGYTKENTRLIHSDCDYKAQAAKGYT